MSNRNRVLPGPIDAEDLNRIREAVCIATEKVYDSCRDKDCIEDAQVIFKCPERIQWLLDRAINVKIRRAEIMDIFADVEEVPFKRGFYTVDVKYFICVTLDFFVPCRRGGIKIKTVRGLVTFDKKVILFGSEGGVKIFKAHYTEHGIDEEMGTNLEQDNLPISIVEAAEPLPLSARIVNVCECHCCCCDFDQLPSSVANRFNNSDDVGGDDDGDEVEAARGGRDDPEKAVLVSIGIFSIIKLVRQVQLLIPAFDFCVPRNECIEATEENPCELFDTIDFPENEFFPPQRFEFLGGEEENDHDHDHHHC